MLTASTLAGLIEKATKPKTRKSTRAAGRVDLKHYLFENAPAILEMLREREGMEAAITEARSLIQDAALDAALAKMGGWGRM